MPAVDRTTLLQTWNRGIARGEIVPLIGPGALSGSRDAADGAFLPVAEADLTRAMNGGRPMSPRLASDLPRAAMALEFRKGRRAVTRFLAALYGGRAWTPTPLQSWIAGLAPPYLIDLNRDGVLAARLGPHLLVQGVARIGAALPRFRLFSCGGTACTPLPADAGNPGGLPVLFKPLGSAEPEAGFVVADADFVDYITELMGGFAVPPFLKAARRGRRYLIAGLPLSRDLERMIVRELIHDADPAGAGWLVLERPNPKEIRFARQMNLILVEAPLAAFWN